MKYSIIITTANEPELLDVCLLSLMSIPKKYDHEILVIAPDEESRNVAKKYTNVVHIQDEGKGKIAALNLGLRHATGDVLVFTDGDCILHHPEHILDAFQADDTGLATGRVMSKDQEQNKWEFFHKFLLGAAHKARKTRFESGNYFESTAYLMAFRKGIIDAFPGDVAEDAWIVSQVLAAGYKHVYVPDSIVAVKGPGNLKDWISQKSRCALAHERVTGPKMKTFRNELSEGLGYTVSQKYSLKQLFWLPQLYIMRLYVWLKVKMMTRQGKTYGDGWKPVASTK